MFSDFLYNFSGKGDNSLRKIVRVIIGGNSIKLSNSVLNECEQINKSLSDFSEFKNVFSLDTLFSHIASTFPLDIMPGELDPSTDFLPQQPLDYSIFPFSSIFKNMHFVTNPYLCTINKKELYF